MITTAADTVHWLAIEQGADVIVSFTGEGGKGGRHIEHGYAMALAMPRIVIVGQRENIFHCHPETQVYPDWGSFLAAEAGIAGEAR